MLSFHNQRSQINFDVRGLYGPRAQLVENLPKRERPAVTEDPSCEHHLYWPSPPETVLVVKKIRDLEVTEKFKTIVAFLMKSLELAVVAEPTVLEEKLIAEDPEFSTIRTKLSTWKDSNRDIVLSKVDFIICIGGDGTILYTASLFKDVMPPVMSFHVGSLGFLTHFIYDTHEQDIRRVIDGNVSLTLRHRLKCVFKTDYEVSTDVLADECPVTPPLEPERKESITFSVKPKLTAFQDPDSTQLVMNELVVDRGPHPYLCNLELFCNGRFMTSVQGDGIIISTPTGSTAYSLAAGASMVHPSVSCMVITPICPHSLSFRPTVLPSGVEMTVRVAANSRNSAWAAYDGRNRREIKQGDSVVVTTSPCPVPTINDTGHVTDWFDSLAECLHWNVRKQQKKL
jgi:NAD+ kinase